MNESVLSRDVAATFASCFRSLSDPTRVQLLAWLAQQSQPVSVGELTEALPIGQSTVSHHLSILAAVGFVQVHRRGTSSLYEVNSSCLDCFPSAADVVMGRLPAQTLDIAARESQTANGRTRP